MIATGPGVNSLHAIGTGIIGGMLASTVIAIFFMPFFFALLERSPAWFDRRAQTSAVAGAPGPAAPHAKREND
ncbi:MAG: efflux RND transporter permease subunit [Gammaproteobacteria bacterium]